MKETDEDFITEEHQCSFCGKTIVVSFFGREECIWGIYDVNVICNECLVEQIKQNKKKIKQFHKDRKC